MVTDVARLLCVKTQEVGEDGGADNRNVGKMRTVDGARHDWGGYWEWFDVQTGATFIA